MEALKASLAAKNAAAAAAPPESAAAESEPEAATGTEGRSGPRALRAPGARRTSSRGKSKS
jgi:hypothetical protein